MTVLRIIWDLIKTNPIAKYLTFGFVLFIIILSVITIRYCSQSDREKRIDELKKDTVISNVNLQLKKEEDEISNRKLQDVKIKVGKLKNKAKELSESNKDYNIEEANKIRCEVYPKDPGC